MRDLDPQLKASQIPCVGWSYMFLFWHAENNNVCSFSLSPFSQDHKFTALLTLISKYSCNEEHILVKDHSTLVLYLYGWRLRKIIARLLLSFSVIDCGYGCQKYLVRLLTYLPGVTVSKVPLTPKLLYETGRMAARMDEVLQKVRWIHSSETLTFYFKAKMLLMKMFEVVTLL